MIADAPDLSLSSAVPPAALAPAADHMEPSDHELMLAVRAGELRKLGDLFERHHRALYGFFVRLTQDRDASEDLVQMVFYRILKYRHTYRDEGKFSAWIYHLARTIAADHFNSRRGRATLAADPEEAPWESLPDQAPAPDVRATVADDLSLLDRALGELSADQRELLVLARFQGLSQEEIAHLLDTTVGAVKVRVHRAFVALRDRYLRLRRTPLA